MINFKMLIVLLTLGFPTILCAAFSTYTFDHDNQGWMYAGLDAWDLYTIPTSSTLDPVSWDTRGNTGGALHAQDTQGETFITAPASNLGDQSDMYGKTFSYDIFVRYLDSNADYASGGITGNGLSLIYIAPPPTLNNWETRFVTFLPSLWRVDSSSGPEASDYQLRSALSDLSGLYIRTEWHTGTDDTSIDNFRTAPVPIPAAVWLMIFGLVGLFITRSKFVVS